jgi:hypothetical protein
VVDVVVDVVVLILLLLSVFDFKSRLLFEITSINDFKDSTACNLSPIDHRCRNTANRILQSASELGVKVFE